jgi:adenylate kinase family enzyme
VGKGTNKLHRWVLDGYPITKEQAVGLEKRDFKPHTIVQLQIDNDELISRAQNCYYSMKAEENPRLNHADIAQLRQSYYAADIEHIRQIFDTKYMNWYLMDAKQSKWLLKEIVVDVAMINLERRQNYLDKKTKGCSNLLRNGRSNKWRWNEQGLHY